MLGPTVSDYQVREKMKLVHNEPKIIDGVSRYDSKVQYKGQLLMYSEAKVLWKQAKALRVGKRFVEFLTRMSDFPNLESAVVDYENYRATTYPRIDWFGDEWYNIFRGALVFPFTNFSYGFVVPKAEIKYKGIINTIEYAPPHLGKGSPHIHARGEFAIDMALELYCGNKVTINSCTECIVPLKPWSTENLVQRNQRTK